MPGRWRDAEKSVTYADRNGDAFRMRGTRTTHADALHQAGRRAEAATRIRTVNDNYFSWSATIKNH